MWTQYTSSECRPIRTRALLLVSKGWRRQRRSDAATISRRTPSRIRKKLGLVCQKSYMREGKSATGEWSRRYPAIAIMNPAHAMIQGRNLSIVLALWLSTAQPTTTPAKAKAAQGKSGNIHDSGLPWL